MPKATPHVCPHCRGPARVRSSRSITPLYRQVNLQCFDPECGHTYAAAFEILHTIVPSAKPSPSVHLPLAPPRRRAANDNPGGLEVPLPLATNDDDGIGEAVATGG